MFLGEERTLRRSHWLGCLIVAPMFKRQYESRTRSIGRSEPFLILIESVPRYYSVAEEGEDTNTTVSCTKHQGIFNKNLGEQRHIVDQGSI